MLAEVAGTSSPWFQEPVDPPSLGELAAAALSGPSVVPAEPDRQTRREWTAKTNAFVENFVAGLEKAPASDLEPQGLAEFLAPPPHGPGELDTLLARFGDAAGQAIGTAGPRCFAYFPAGGLYSSVLAETLAHTVNRFTGLSGTAPALVAVEHSVIRWLCGGFGLPDSAGGLVTFGASIATLTALHAAREDRLGGPDPRGTIYVTEHTHHCVAKAARITGFTADQVRVVPVDANLRMDVDAAEQLIARDRARGLRRFFLVGTAGSTSTGTVDPLDAVGEVAEREDLWFHVDGAYGGAFQFTERGRRVLHGVHRADSITLDPHKSCSCLAAPACCSCAASTGCGRRTSRTPTTCRTSATTTACPTTPTSDRS